jgi:holo-[acyl-carrier protein] synthase
MSVTSTGNTVEGRILGIGVDLVHVPSFAEQLALPESRFRGLFTPGERADIQDRSSHDGAHDREGAHDGARHWAVRWAAKEAVIKAWSASIFGEEPVLGDEAFGQIETVTDTWGRPRIALHGDVARELAGYAVDVSLSHDGDHAIAYVVLSAPTS